MRDAGAIEMRNRHASSGQNGEEKGNASRHGKEKGRSTEGDPPEGDTPVGNTLEGDSAHGRHGGVLRHGGAGRERCCRSGRD